jgi:hypothetical protein
VAVNYYPTKKQGEGLSISERIHYCNIPFFHNEAGVSPPPPQNVKRKDQKGGLFGQKLWKSRTNPIKIQKELCLMSTKRLDPAKPNATTESRQPYTKNNSG